MAQASNPEYQRSLEMVGVARDIIAATARQNLSVVTDLMKIGTTAAGGIASATTNQQPVSESLNRRQINELFGITGNKVDASKLQKAWEKAGSPTDSEEIAKILQKAGVDSTVISKAYTDMSLPEPTVASAPAPENKELKSLLDQILKLDAKSQKQILAKLQTA
jgi:hypothetical protein